MRLDHEIVCEGDYLDLRFTVKADLPMTPAVISWLQQCGRTILAEAERQMREHGLRVLGV